MADNTQTGIEGERQANWAETANFYMSHDVAFQWFFHINGADAGRRLDNYNAHKDFFRSSGASVSEIQRFDDAYIIADISKDSTVKEGILSQYVAGKTPDQLLDGLVAADPSRRDLFEIIRADQNLKSSVHTAISQDPSVFYAFSGMTGANSSLNLDKLTAELADPAKRDAFATSLRQVGENATLTGSDLVATMSSNNVEIQARQDLVDGANTRFLETLTGKNALWEESARRMGGGDSDWNSVAGLPEGIERDKALSALIGQKTSTQLLDSLQAASPESKEVIDILRADTTLSEALHRAASEDYTVIPGLAKLMGPSSGLDGAGLANALADPQTRTGLLTMLDKVGQDGHDGDLKFDDLAEAVQSGMLFSRDPKNGAAAERYKAALKRFELEDNRIMMAQIMADPGAALMQMIEDPHTFFANIRSALGNIAPGGFIDSALSIVENGVASWTQDPQIHAFMDTYNVASGAKEIQNLQSQFGIKATTAEAPATPAASDDNASAAPVVKETQDVGSVENPAVVSFNANLTQHAATGVKVAEVADASIKFGAEGKGYARDAFGSSASGIVPAEELQDFGNEMRRNLTNNNMSFSMVG